MDSIIIKNVANMYRSPSTDCEMVSQTTLGHQVLILQENPGWACIRAWDGYSGWVKSEWIRRVDPNNPSNRKVMVYSLFADALREPCIDAGILTKLVITSMMELISDDDPFAHCRLPDGRETWIERKHLEKVETNADQPNGCRIIRTAERFLGIPYLWGGTTPFGLDCSGFTQLVYRINGIDLPRDASMQAEDRRGETVEKDALFPGDLIFFATPGKRISHVGLALGKDTFIHSAGRGEGVRINHLNDEPYADLYRNSRRISQEYPE